MNPARIVDVTTTAVFSNFKIILTKLHPQISIPSVLDQIQESPLANRPNQPLQSIMHSKNRGWMILALFFCSGATALVYEVVWSKFLSQMFGSTIYAQTVVLAAFMGGLALGNRFFGRWADGLRQPVR